MGPELPWLLKCQESKARYVVDTQLAPSNSSVFISTSSTFCCKGNSKTKTKRPSFSLEFLKNVLRSKEVYLEGTYRMRSLCSKAGPGEGEAYHWIRRKAGQGKF